MAKLSKDITSGRSDPKQDGAILKSFSELESNNAKDKSILTSDKGIDFKGGKKMAIIKGEHLQKNTEEERLSAYNERFIFLSAIMQKQREAINSAYRIGHLFSNTLTAIRGTLSDSLDNIKTYIDNNDYDQAVNQIAITKEKFKCKIADMANLFVITDMLAKAHDLDDEFQGINVFKRNRSSEGKTPYTSNDPLQVGSLIRSLFDEYAFDYDLKPPDAINATIKPFVKDYSDKYAVPTDILYKALFTEIIINFRSHRKEKIYELEVYCDTIDNKEVLVFRNEINATNEIPMTPIFTKGMSGTGAIHYISSIFDSLEIGKIYFRVISIDGKCYYEMLLFLEGLTINKNRHE